MKVAMRLSEMSQSAPTPTWTLRAIATATTPPHTNAAHLYRRGSGSYLSSHQNAASRNGIGTSAYVSTRLVPATLPAPTDSKMVAAMPRSAVSTTRTISSVWPR